MVPQTDLEIISFPSLNPLSTNPTKWSNTLKQFVGDLQRLSQYKDFIV